jgi:enolase
MSWRHRSGQHRSSRRPRDPRLAWQPDRRGRGAPRRRHRGPGGRAQGASTGAFEAYEKRDGDKKRYLGKGVEKAVDAVLDEINPAIMGFDASEQRLIDAEMLTMDGSKNKENLGANAILGVSLAVARAAADSANLPLYRYVGGPNAHMLAGPDDEHPQRWLARRHQRRHPGVHDRPDRCAVLQGGAALGAEVYHMLKKVLHDRGLSTGLGDEGGFAPNLESNRAALDVIMEAIEKAGYSPGKDIALALDVAATEFYKDGAYQFEGAAKSAAEMTAYYAELVAAYPLVSIEDPMNEEDWDGWKAITDALGAKVQLVGDDLFVTNPERLQRGIDTARPTPCSSRSTRSARSPRPSTRSTWPTATATAA